MSKSFSIKNPYKVAMIEKGDLDVIVEVFKDDPVRNALVLEYMQAVYNFVGGIGSEEAIAERQLELDIYDNVYDPTDDQ